MWTMHPRSELESWTASDQECCLTSPHQFKIVFWPDSMFPFYVSRWTGGDHIGFQQSILAYHGLESDHSGFISAQLHSSLTANLGFVPLLSSSSCYLQMVVRRQISQPWWQFLLFYLHGVGFDFLRTVPWVFFRSYALNPPYVV